MYLFGGETGFAGDCRILKSVDFSRLVGLKIQQVALRHPVKDTGEGPVLFDLWEFTPEAMSAVDSRIKSVALWVVNKSGPRPLRGRVAFVSLAVRDILQDDALYQEYFGGCGPGDPKQEGILLRQDICLWATHKHSITVEITNEGMDRVLYKNSKLRGCRSF